MAIEVPDAEIAAFLDRWFGSMATSREEAAALRDEAYAATLSNDLDLTAGQELDLIFSGALRVSAPTGEPAVRRTGDEAIVACWVDIGHDGEAVGSRQRYELRLARAGGRWRARGSRLRSADRATTPDAERRPGSLPRRVASRLGGWLKRMRRPPTVARPAAPEPDYVPYRPGADYVIRPADLGPADAGGDGLPLPPESLWLGYYYPVHGKVQVERMLEIVAASGFAFGKGDRILDLGCAAGRMIRHLKGLAATCEIWGADIRAEHIRWCKHNLSPPFHFVTNTRAPHLPFEDRSFRLIYCGSLFTHLDELADAWLRELHRLLAPDGRLYVTIHDKHTVELFDEPRYASAAVVKEITSSPVFQDGSRDFSLLAVGRSAVPQIFYDLDYFVRSIGPGWEILSVTPEAYYYQTAVLLRRVAG